MKIIYFIPVIFLLSCKSIKVKGIENDSTQKLIGKIKQMNVNTFRYAKDTIMFKENKVVFFDMKNKIIKQINYYPKIQEETIFNYKNELLQNTTSKIGKRTRRTEYVYDTNKNIIKYNHFENDTLFFSKISIYDKKNNPLKQTYLHPHPSYKSINSVEVFFYDYKNKVITIKSFDENNKTKNHYLKTYFNKKGLIIKTESFNMNSNNIPSTSSKSEYDNLGNLIKRTNIGVGGKPKQSIEYKNTYDITGNIILREMYFNKKLNVKTMYEITYW